MEKARSLSHKPSMRKLVIQAQQGDREAFGNLMETHRSLLMRYIRRVFRLQTVDAEDVFQTVCLKALGAIQQVQYPRRFTAWLYKTAWTTGINYLTRRDTRALLHSTNGLSSVAAPLCGDWNLERMQQVIAGMHKLSTSDRDVLQEHYFDGWSLKRMSAKHRVPIGTIKSRLNAARQRLRSEVRA